MVLRITSDLDELTTDPPRHSTSFSQHLTDDDALYDEDDEDDDSPTPRMNPSFLNLDQAAPVRRTPSTSSVSYLDLNVAMGMVREETHEGAKEVDYVTEAKLLCERIEKTSNPNPQE
eukprot:c11336_g2_i1.p1 GENE.c11336_g2_i1~~c11336_g2_i1.p1  ORF type:complete len:117 (+),score=31.14 c11336_g2_i1:2-352(+)